MPSRQKHDPFAIDPFDHWISNCFFRAEQGQTSSELSAHDPLGPVKDDAASVGKLCRLGYSKTLSILGTQQGPFFQCSQSLLIVGTVLIQGFSSSVSGGGDRCFSLVGFHLLKPPGIPAKITNTSMSDPFPLKPTGLKAAINRSPRPHSLRPLGTQGRAQGP